MSLGPLSKIEEMYLVEIASAILPRESEQADAVGVSLKYLNAQLKHGGRAFLGSARSALLRARKSLEARGYIQTYHMDKWQMVGKGKATHVIIPTRVMVMIMYLEAQQTAGVSRGASG